MSPLPSCPQCGAPLPADALAGLCPACLMSAGIPSQVDADATLLMEKPKTHDLPQVGETFGGYRIERELGHGGMGAVYAAEHLESGRRVALKVLSRQLDSPEARARFLREGRLAASINHPNSVYVFGTEEVHGTPVISMELIAGGTLQERVQHHGPMPVGEAVDAVLQIIAGLEAAQAIGILHRDIKPANCFLDMDGTVKVGDFGLSISTAARGESHLTLPGDFLGTPAFCPPEQLRGDEINVRSDMYAVGVTLFYLLTGRTPFEGKNMVQVLANSLERPAPSPTQFRPQIPKSLSRVVLRCLEKLPASRFATYEELRRALTPFSASSPTPATLGLRFLAEVVDHFVFTTINMLIPVLFFRDIMYFTDPAHLGSAEWMWLTGGLFALKALYYAVLEGVWGATLGKALVGLRVARLNRGAPGIPRALGRFMLLTWPALLSYAFYDYDARAEQTLFLAYGMGALWVAYVLGMFSTIRRKNGFAAVHDLLTGTRVIQKAAYHPQVAMAAMEDKVTTTEAMPKVGPYHVLATLSTSEAQTLLLGYDTRLLRKVWIRHARAGEAPVAAALRNAARPTRLRWLQGYRGDDAAWDAYEAAEGTPLRELLRRERQPWQRVRQWLLDLASELETSTKDGSAPVVLSLDRVWITTEGRAKLLDFSAPAMLPPDGAACDSPPVFLNQVAMAALEGRLPSVEEASTQAVAAPLPIEARNVVRQIRTAASLSAVVTGLRPLMQRPPTVSRWKRATVLMSSAAPAVVIAAFMLIGVLVSQGIMRNNPLVMELDPCLRIYESIRKGEKPKGMEQVALPDTKAAMEVYISGKFGPLIRDPKVWSAPMMKGMLPSKQRAVAEKMIEDHPQPSEAEFARAQATLQPLLATRLAERAEGYKSFAGMGPFVVTSTSGVILVLTAVLSVTCALVFRGGLLFRILGIAVVKNNGANASRGRMLWRAILAWSPVLLIPVVWMLMAKSFKHSTDSLFVWEKTVQISGLAGAAAVLAMASLAMRGRGLHDRLAGTWLVPR